MTDACPICQDYLFQLRRASARGDEKQYSSILALYMEHLERVHLQVKNPVGRELVRLAFGRFGE
jgi:hypothetical protein